MSNTAFEDYGEVTLAEVLDARDKRVEKQRELLEKYNCALVCFTMNIAGPVKASRAIDSAFDHGCERLAAMLPEKWIKQLSKQYSKCGPLCFAVVDADPVEVKKLCVSIEEESPVGRLFDMDVIAPDGRKLDRAVERRCIVCGKQGRACAASRAHSVSELQKATADLLKKY